MSAIISGTSCKGCGKKYWYSLGHPKWYDDVVKRDLEASKQFIRYVENGEVGNVPEMPQRIEKEGRKWIQLKNT